MSSQDRNVALVRRILELPDWDLDRFREAVPEALDPDVEWCPIEESRTVRGHEAVIASLEGWFEAMDEFTVELEDTISAPDRVIAVTRQRAVGRGSGAGVDARIYQVYTFREGKIRRFEEFMERDDALAAAGIE